MAVKKSAKKSAKKVAAKKVAKRAVKKSTAKRTVAKKTATKKSTSKKSAAKKVAKRAVKKSARRSSTSSIVIPAVPSTQRRAPAINVTTTPTPKTEISQKRNASPKKSNSSTQILIALVIGFALIFVVVSGQFSSKDDKAQPAPSMSASPKTSSSEEPAPSMSASPSEKAPEPVGSVEAPTRFIGNWTDSSKTVLRIQWNAPSATEGLVGYKFETRSNNGQWKERSALPTTTTSLELTKSGTDGWTSFQVSSVYADGQTLSAKAFGFGGQFK